MSAAPASLLTASLSTSSLSTSSLRRLAFAVLVGFVVFALMAAEAMGARAAAAQEGPESAPILASSPAADSTVGGHIDLIDVQFSGPIENPGLLVTAPDATEIEGVLTQPAPDRLYFQMIEPISEDGPYWIDYAVVAASGEEIISRFGFNYRSAAPSPIPLYEPPRFTNLQLVTMGVVFGLFLVGIRYLVTHRAKTLTES